MKKQRFALKPMPIVRAMPALAFAPQITPAHAGLIFYPSGKVECTAYAPLLHELAADGTKKTRHPQQAEAGQGSQSSRDSSKMATQRFIEASNSSSLLFWNKIRLSLWLRVGSRFSGCKVAPAQILIPVSQLPSVAVRVALDHSLVDDLG